MNISIIAPYTCPGCGQRSDKCLNRTGDRPPRPGDYSICHRCASVNIFTKEMSLREASAIERARLYGSDLGPLACEMRSEILFGTPEPAKKKDPLATHQGGIKA